MKKKKKTFDFKFITWRCTNKKYRSPLVFPIIEIVPSENFLSFPVHLLLRFFARTSGSICPHRSQHNPPSLARIQRFFSSLRGANLFSHKSFSVFPGLTLIFYLNPLFFFFFRYLEGEGGCWCFFSLSISTPLLLA